MLGLTVQEGLDAGLFCMTVNLVEAWHAWENRNREGDEEGKWRES